MDIWVLNKNYERIAVVDTFESFIWTDRYYGFGDFELYTDMDASLLSIFQEDYYLQIEESDRTMIIESFEITTDIEKGNKLIVRGRSLESITQRRRNYSQKLLNSSIQDAIREIIRTNFIDPDAGIIEKIIPNLIFSVSSDPLVTTPTIKAQYQGDDIGLTILELCRQFSIGFRIVLDSSNQFVCSVYAGVDRSYSQSTNPYVIFSPKFDNLIRTSYFQSSRDRKTYGIVLGYVDANNVRTVAGVAIPNWNVDPNIGLGFREFYLDATTKVNRFYEGTTNLIPLADFLDQLKTEGRTVLYGSQELVQFDGQAETTNSYKYRTDFFLGDIVQIENEYGLKGKSRITEVTISENLSGKAIYPTFEKID